MDTLIERVKYLLKMMLWATNGLFGKRYVLAGSERLTVLITYFNPARMTVIDHQLRNILKCMFVERVIISNHNPDVNIENKIKVKDARIKILNQPVKRGCGFRWHIASEFNPEYLVVIDDDIFLFPAQLTRLYRFLLSEPEILHGLSGINCPSHGSYEFRVRVEKEIDFLCEIYALTKEHLSRYMEFYSDLSSNPEVIRIVDSTTDFVVLSHTGASKPKIHDVGRLFRSETFKLEGVAIHKGVPFYEYVEITEEAIRNRDHSKAEITS